MGFFDNVGTGFGDDSGVGGIWGTGLEILDGVVKVKHAIDSINGKPGAPAPSAPTVMVDPALKYGASQSTAPLLVIGAVALVVLFVVLRR